DEPNAAALAADQVAAFQQAVAPVDAAFAPDTKEALRKSVLESSFTLSPDARATLVKITAERWKDVRAEASRVLAATESKEIRDPNGVQDARAGLANQMVLDPDERTLAAELISPLIVSNSAYSETLTNQARQAAADAVPDVMVDYSRNQ